MNWALKRQALYVIILIVFVGTLGLLVTYPYFHKAPTCFDGKQNGNETGIDCGGSCALACTDQVNKISILWARSFEVVPGRYNAVAYLENKNTTAAVDKITYTFRFADQNNVYIGKRDGTAFIPPGQRFAIFEPAVDVGNSVPVYTTFQFTENPVWIQVPAQKVSELQLAISNINLSGQDTAPKLSASIQNNSLFIIPNLNVVAILYDAAGNAVSASSTYIAQLNGGSSSDLNFTWPEPFTSSVISEEILPVYNIFDVKI
jgi:hypothetical protein